MRRRRRWRASGTTQAWGGRRGTGDDGTSGATHSRWSPMIEEARMGKDRRKGVLNFFTHRITNAVAEGWNSKVATIQKRT